MVNIKVVRSDDVVPAALPDLPAGATAVADVFGEKDGAPIDFGVWTMAPYDEPVQFSYAAESICIRVLSGTLRGTSMMGEMLLGSGDFVFVQQSDDAQVSWQAVDGPVTTVFACHPHYPRV